MQIPGSSLTSSRPVGVREPEFHGKYSIRMKRCSVLAPMVNERAPPLEKTSISITGQRPPYLCGLECWKMMVSKSLRVG